MQTLKTLKSIFIRKPKPEKVQSRTPSATPKSSVGSSGSSALISLQQLETIALSSVKLAAMGPRLAAVAGKMEKQADEQARHAAHIADGTKLLTERLNAALVRLQDASVNVHSVVGDITRIAEQTRILSINASIEAGRAGEQGRAFNVVAQEVQQLAAQTRDSTHAIDTKVQAIQGSVRELESSVGEQSREKTNGSEVAAITVQTVNSEVQAMATTAQGQRADAHSLHGLGEQANHLSEELLLAVGGFRLAAHKQAARELEGVLATVAACFGERELLENELLGWLQNHAGFELIYVTDRDGRQVVDNVGWKSDRTELDAAGFGRDWRDRPWYRNALQKPEAIAISDIYRSAATRDFCFTVSAVIFGPNKESLGVIGADVNFQRLLTGNLRR